MLDPARLVFIDETAVSTNMVRLRGRAPRGVRLIGRVPLGEWETITFGARLAAQQNDRADGGRRANDGRDVPGLCRAMPGPNAQAQRQRRDG
jgi:hypothetical protein